MPASKEKQQKLGLFYVRMLQDVTCHPARWILYHVTAYISSNWYIKSYKVGFEVHYLVSSFVSYTSLYTTIHQNKGKYQVVPWVNLDHNIDTVHTAPAGCIQIKGKRIHNNIPCITSLLYLGSKLSNHFMSQKVEQFDTQQYPFREKKNKCEAKFNMALT